jgi:hypothetical protein
MPALDHKLKPWLDARTRFKLTHAEVQMARELGMNPKDFASLANAHQQPWKTPLQNFIQKRYRQSFGREAPEQVLTLEEIIAAQKSRQAGKAARVAASAARRELSVEDAPDSAAPLVT